ncbi:phospholipase D family protein [Leptospira wolffii]|uniref:phospholipase D family protein n=1 Tax=Leptospira wolffii TaxID=409998 RepID=UPI0003533295|nr:phospholipase D family protein [Leptospira wolffii]EPG66444.1 PLD-like domain protein [Leptospira wolffii serovar Khorat str. Khorat-H2]
MAIIRPIFQHFYSNGDHSELLTDLFRQPNFGDIIIMTAFSLSRGVIDLLGDSPISDKNIIVYTGIRNEITSAQALHTYLKVGCKLFCVDTGRSDLIFHPKLYLAYNSDNAKAVIGSANTTLGGLRNNIESSFLVLMDRHDPEDERLFQEILTTASNFHAEYPNNVLEVINHSQVTELFNKGLVSDERQIPLRQSSKRRGDRTNLQTDTPRININIRHSDISTQDLSGIPVITDEPHDTYIENDETLETPNLLILRGQLVYEKSSLSRSDAQIVPEGSNPTGNIRLARSNFTINGQQIDWRIYFRNEVFGSYDWQVTDLSKPTQENALVSFRIFLMGIYYGHYDLRLSHDPEREAGQNNVPTWLHWGTEVGKIIRQLHVENRTLRIYAPDATGQPFTLTID